MMKSLTIMVVLFVGLLAVSGLTSALSGPQASEPGVAGGGREGIPALTPVQSAAMRALSYQTETRQLTVQFADGRIYVYRDVPAEVYAGLVRTPHKGGYFSRFIRGRYPARRVADPE